MTESKMNKCIRIAKEKYGKNLSEAKRYCKNKLKRKSR